MDVRRPTAAMKPHPTQLPHSLVKRVRDSLWVEELRVPIVKGFIDGLRNDWSIGVIHRPSINSDQSIFPFDVWL